MISKEKLIKTLLKGRYECYVRKNSSYNPYTKSVVYDWDFKLEIDDLIFTDSYRGFNPYSGVEYVYEKDNNTSVWSCDYVGYINKDTKVSSEEIYKFLKEARGNHLKNCKDNLFSNSTYENDLFKYERLGYSSVESSYHLWTHALIVSLIFTVIVCTMSIHEEINEIKAKIGDSKKEE